VTTPTEQTNTTGAATATYLAAAAALRARLLAYVAALYAAQGNYRDAAAAAFVASAVPAVQAAQQTMAALTSAYLAHLIAATAGGSTTPIGISLDALSSLRGVDPTEVYRRPYVQVWTDLSRGKPFDDAVAAGARRATSLAATDLQLAKTHTAREVMRDDRRVTGYRRVLTGPHSCALCVLASTRWYSRGDLSPIHNNCDCAVEPLFGGARPDEVPAEELHAVIARDLGDKYVSASGRAGPIDYHKILVTHNHGELGPVLTVRDQHFTGPSDIPGG
jgi:hypothetical protein